jgi:hypothetical protein
MARPTTTDGDFASYQRRYRELAAQLAEIGFIASGSIVVRYTRCASAGCRCRADPPQRHGPYYQWSAKIDGKTVTRRLTEREAALYQQWIDNDRQLRGLINQMRNIAGHATRLILDANTQTAEV